MESLFAAPVVAALIFVGVALRGPAELLSRQAAAALVRARPARTDGRLDLSALRAEEFAAPAAQAFASGAKRCLDVLSAMALLVALAPLLIAVAVAIRLDSPGPILFRQKRVGFGGRVFEIYKFRSMAADAEKAGPQWAAADDTRITRVGRLIRRVRIDEIPQALNVLRGDMSFVGPRPERPEFVELLEREIPNYALRHLVKPGITGWAQVKYIYAASVEDARIKLQYDLFYIKNFSVIRDIAIMLATVKVALFGLGSR